ncbi:MAG: hypothetical protein JW941_11805 [Candidatus Coatesbacteria bacterium]|nr:hypothetical protein [Candidatus Coatesbacteria bacterium]
MAPKGHIITRLFISLFGDNAPAPISLIHYQIDDSWGYLCETASLDAALGGAQLIRGATSLNQPLGLLARHCHLRASVDESLLSAARLLDDCLIVNTCSRGLVIAPSAAAPAIADAISRFVAVATLSSSARCNVTDVYPTELAFGYRAKERWFDEFARDAESIGSEGLKLLGFDYGRESVRDRARLSKAFRARKNFGELARMAMFSSPVANNSPIRNQYESSGAIAHCEECYQRPASYALPATRALCEPCHWRVSVGASMVQKTLKDDSRSFLRDSRRFAAIAILCDPFQLVFGENSSISSSISARNKLASAIDAVADEIQDSLPDPGFVVKLSPCEMLFITRGDDCDRCSDLAEKILPKRLSEHGIGEFDGCRMGCSGAEYGAPIGMHVREAISHALGDGCRRVHS